MIEWNMLGLNDNLCPSVAKYFQDLLPATEQVTRALAREYDRTVVQMITKRDTTTDVYPVVALITAYL